MPTLIPLIEKDAFIALVEAAPPVYGGPLEASRQQDLLIYYEDIYNAIMRQLPLFATNNGYLTQALGVFDDQQLLNVGIWNNKNVGASSPPITDPVLIANSTIVDGVYITFTSPPILRYLTIIGNSSVDLVYVESYVNLLEMYIGPGSVVNMVDSSSEGAAITNLYLPFLKSTPSRLNSAKYNSQIGQILPREGGGYFGGYTNDNPSSPCAVMVTDLAVGLITSDSAQLTWTSPMDQSPPSQYLFINVYFRIEGSNEWILADETLGHFNGESGYTFTSLEGDSNYEFYVEVTCINGGINNSSRVVAKTQCCA